MSIPTEMKAVVYSAPREWKVASIPVPEVGDNHVLVKVAASGFCGTDLEIHDGGFMATFPLTPGHEVSGHVAAVGKNVTAFKVGDQVVADNSELCERCYHCRRNDGLYCEKFMAHGVVGLQGSVAEYVSYLEHKVYKVKHLNPLDATLVEPATCAVHGLLKIAPKPGSTVLLMGAGPTGLVLAQLLKCNGGADVTIAANAGAKMQLARKLEAGDRYIDLDRKDAESQWAQLKSDNPQGFDIVIEATGVPKLLEKAIGLAAMGGKVVCYGVYDKEATVNVHPNDIFSKELNIMGSFSSLYNWDATLKLTDTPYPPRVRVAGIVNRTYKVEDWGKALEELRTDKSIVKAAIVFDDALML